MVYIWAGRKITSMKKIVLIVIMLRLVLLAQAQAPQKMDELMNAYAELGKFNGTILVAAKDSIVLQKGYGYRDFAGKLPNDANTVYQIASVTKTFTATLVLKLVELKKLLLSDRLSRFYPNFPKADSVTIEQLLSHTSGIVDDFADTTDRKLIGTPEEKFVAALARRKFGFSPGTGWRYSNSGYILLGYIIQQLTGLDYFAAVRKYILTPLHMRHSGFDFTGGSDRDKATGYWTFPASDTVQPATLIDSSGPRAAGGMFATAGDLYQWHRALQTGTIVSRSLLEQAYSPVRNHYGYGWIVDSVAGAKVVSHSGDIWGFKAEFTRVPGDDICIVLLSNIEDEDLNSIARKILAIAYRQPYQLPAKNRVRLDPSILEQYTGAYTIRPGDTIRVTTENGHLMSTTGRKQELYAQEENLFLIDDGREQLSVTFEKGPSGEITGLSFKNHGQKTTCKKVR